MSRDLSLTFVMALAAVAGAVVGSFLNVIVYRLPLGRSVVMPGSSCPRCGHSLSWWENLPVLSWLLLGGRCHDCRAPIALRYPAVELLTAVTFAWVTWEWDGGLIAAAYCCLAASMTALVLIEWDGHPAPLPVSGWGVTLALLVLMPTSIKGHDWRTLLGPMVGTAVGGAALVRFRRADPTGCDRNGFGRGAELLAGCWLGALPVSSLAAASVTAGGYALFAAAYSTVARRRVRTVTAGSDAGTSPSTALRAPFPMALAAAMVAALLVAGRWP